MLSVWGTCFAWFLNAGSEVKTRRECMKGKRMFIKMGKTAFLELILMRCVCVCFSVYASYFKFAEQVFTPGGLERKPGDLAVFPEKFMDNRKSNRKLRQAISAGRK